MSRKLGDKEPFDLAKLGASGTVRIEHKGPGWARRQQIRLQGLLHKAQGNVIALRRQYTADEWPALYATNDNGLATFVTEADELATLEFAKQLLSECLSAEDLARVEYLGLIEPMMVPVLDIQRVGPVESF